MEHAQQIEDYFPGHAQEWPLNTSLASGGMERNICDGLTEWIQPVAQTDGGNLGALRQDGPVPESLQPDPYTSAVT
eukprot:1975372-Lingulodinium_polyedra.AAC.1